MPDGGGVLHVYLGSSEEEEARLSCWKIDRCIYRDGFFLPSLLWVENNHEEGVLPVTGFTLNLLNRGTFSIFCPRGVGVSSEEEVKLACLVGKGLIGV